MASAERPKQKNPDIWHFILPLSVAAMVIFYFSLQAQKSQRSAFLETGGQTPTPSASPVGGTDTPSSSTIYYDAHGDGFLEVPKGVIPEPGTPFQLPELGNITLKCASVRGPGDTALALYTEVIGLPAGVAKSRQHLLVHKENPATDLLVFPNGISSRQFGLLNEDDVDQACVGIN